MGHSRAEGHDIEGKTTPDEGIHLTQNITAGSFNMRGEPIKFALGHIIGSLQGDLLLTVTFPDGESVAERLDMSGLLTNWASEIAHSKQMRDDYGAENV